MSAATQTLEGPGLVVPYTMEVRRQEKHEKTGVWQEVWAEVKGVQTLVPRSLELEGAVDIEARRRGLYRTQVFKVAGPLKGTFAVAPMAGLAGGKSLRLGEPYLALGISDPRGILNRVSLRMEGKDLPFQPGTRLDHPGQGIHAPLPGLDLTQARSFSFEIPLELLGTRSLHLAPVAEETRVSLQGAWPAPSFEGGFAPLERTWSSQGFRALWKIPHLSRDLKALLAALMVGTRRMDWRRTPTPPPVPDVRP